MFEPPGIQIAIRRIELAGHELGRAEQIVQVARFQLRLPRLDLAQSDFSFSRREREPVTDETFPGQRRNLAAGQAHADAATDHRDEFVAADSIGDPRG
jgi:hypothetical protein